MDILKKLINNPELQHVAKIVIGYLDEDEDFETLYVLAETIFH